MPDSLRPHGLQHARFPGFHHLSEFAQTHVHWCSDAIQPSHPVTPFYPGPQSFPASGSFPMSWFFTSGGQSNELQLHPSILPINIQGWFPLRFSSVDNVNSSSSWPWNTLFVTSLVSFINVLIILLSDLFFLSFFFQQRKKRCCPMVFSFVLFPINMQSYLSFSI